MNPTSLETIDADALEAATGGASKPSSAAKQAELTKMLTQVTESMKSLPSQSRRPGFELPAAAPTPTPASPPVPDTIPYAK